MLSIISGSQAIFKKVWQTYVATDVLIKTQSSILYKTLW